MSYTRSMSTMHARVFPEVHVTLLGKKTTNNDEMRIVHDVRYYRTILNVLYRASHVYVYYGTTLTQERCTRISRHVCSCITLNTCI